MLLEDDDARMRSVHYVMWCQQVLTDEKREEREKSSSESWGELPSGRLLLLTYYFPNKEVLMDFARRWCR